MQDTRRDEREQFALPLVIRVERAAPPARTDALEGAARGFTEVAPGSATVVAEHPVLRKLATSGG